MNETAKQDFISHAKMDYPKECCGLLIQFNDKCVYMPCRNISQTPEQDFTIHPSDITMCEDFGEIIGICHSHPDSTSKPSQTDLAKASALKEEYPNADWYIFSWPEGDLHRFTPDSTIPLLGRKFIHGVLDCYSLVRDYYKTIGITLPDFDREDGWWGTEKELYLDNFESAGFTEVCGSAPEELKAFELLVGDVILMQIRSKRVNHAAVYIGDGKIIHHMYGKLSKTDVYGGFWLRNTRLIVRHRSNN